MRLRDAGFIGATDLRNMLRQRETILWVFLMPIVFFYFIGTVTGGYGRPRADRPEPLVLDAPDATDVIVSAIARKLTAQNFAVRSPSPAGGEDEAPRVLTVPRPAGGRTVADAVAAGEQQVMTYRTRSEGPTAEFERVRVSRAVYGVLADLAVLRSEGQAVEPDALERLDATTRPVRLAVESAGRRRQVPTGFAQTVPGTMVMFTMLVSLTSGGIILVLERRLGLLRRLAAAPISRGSIVGGKWAARLALALVQIAFAMLTGTVLFGMDWGAALPMVLLLLLSWAAFNASLALLLGSLARTEGQMAGLGVLTSMALGALGGCWWPIEITPRWMQSLALLLPTGWTMNAMHRLVNFGDPAVVAIPHVLALLAGALLLGWAATRVFRYE